MKWELLPWLGIATSACASIGGLDQYTQGQCTGNCAAADGAASLGAPDASLTSDDASADGVDDSVSIPFDDVSGLDASASDDVGGGADAGNAADVGGGIDADGNVCTPMLLPPSINLDVTQWASNFIMSPIWNCNAAGTTTIDSSAGTISSTSCALGAPDFTSAVTQTSSGGPAVMAVRLRGLTVSNGHVLKLQGNQPIVLLVAGSVLIDLGGKIDAGTTGTTPGAGGSLSGNCAGSTGANESNGQWGGGGGGFGTPGGAGGTNGRSGAAGGGSSSVTTLQPLRGGCSGGTGGNGAGAAGAGGGAFEISASGTITIGTGTNSATLNAAGGGSPAVTRGQNVGSGGGGSGGGILLVSPVAASFATNGAARAHGGASGGAEGCSCNPETSADNGQDGHSTDNNLAAGGASNDINGASGVSGGLCAGSGCSVASAAGANGTTAQAQNSGSGGGGGGGRIQVIATAATTVCQ